MGWAGEGLSSERRAVSCSFNGFCVLPSMHACVRGANASHRVLKRTHANLGDLQFPNADVDATLEDASVPHAPRSLTHSLRLTHSDSLTQTRTLSLRLTHRSTEYAGRLSSNTASLSASLSPQLLRSSSHWPHRSLAAPAPRSPAQPMAQPFTVTQRRPPQTKFALTIWITLARGLKRGRRQGTVLTANETVDVAGDVAGLPLSLW